MNVTSDLQIFPHHALNDIISAVKKSNLNFDEAIQIVLTEYPIPQVQFVETQPKQVATVTETKKEEEKEVQPIPTVKEEVKSDNQPVTSAVQPTEEQIQKVTFSTLSLCS